ncbi:MAG: O-antigen polymerase [Candidatus Micrarchaeota archaeon]
MRYIQSTDFCIHLLILWWVLWLTVSCSELNEYIRPSFCVRLQYIMFIFLFIVGYLTVRFSYRCFRSRAVESSLNFKTHLFRMRFIIYFVCLLSFIVLIFSLYSSGAFSTDFTKYLIKLRTETMNDKVLTGYKYVDILTKFLIFPSTYTLILLVLSVGIKKFKMVFFLSILNFLLYSYLWQVNYPMIHLFWFIFFFMLLQFVQKSSFDWRIFILLSSIATVLILSSINRFGGDWLGAVQTYIVDYHLVGFSFYDYQYNNSGSILHIHSYGRSSLGFIDQVVDLISRRIDVDYKAASFENSTYNDIAVDIGFRNVREINAFGTFLFSFYRDFNFIGIAVGGYLYGAFITYTLLNYKKSWICRVLFFLLSTTWMMGMMVSPVEQGYFWFSILFLGLLKVISRGVSFGSSQLNRG